MFQTAFVVRRRVTFVALVLAFLLSGCSNDGPTRPGRTAPLHLVVTFAPPNSPVDSSALQAIPAHGIEMMRAYAYRDDGGASVFVDADSMAISPEDTRFRLQLNVESGTRQTIYVLAEGTHGAPPHLSEFGVTYFGSATLESARRQTLEMTLTTAVPTPVYDGADRLAWEPIEHAIGYEVWETDPDEEFRVVQTNATGIEISPGIPGFARGETSADHFVYQLRSTFPGGFAGALSETLRVTNRRPSQILDLAIDETGFDHVVLSWTAPGGDGTQGRTASYDVRRATFPIRTEFDFGRATRVQDPPVPASFGERQTFRIDLLDPATSYAFAIIATDGSGNRSRMSNSIEGRTGDDPSAACCFADGRCSLLRRSVCLGAGGSFESLDAVCDPNPCPQPVIACCFATGSCELLTEAVCESRAGEARERGSVCDPNPCPQPPSMEACCFTDGTCAILTIVECGTASGLAQGPDTVCDPNPCPQPPAPEACCFADGSCSLLVPPACAKAGGIAEGLDTHCDPNPCPQPEPEGACCQTEGVCAIATEATCASAGGNYLGDETDCDPNPCPQPPQVSACCFSDGSCVLLSEADCLSIDGTWSEGDEVCDPNPCPPPPPFRACCFEDGTCRLEMASGCTDAGGVWRDDDDSCAPNPCPQPPPSTEACCFDSGVCSLFTPEDCIVAGGTSLGAETVCEPNSCPQPEGACCLADLSCVLTTELDCSATPGNFLGVGTVCDPNPCLPPQGACCAEDGTCLEQTESECSASAGVYEGDETVCSPNPCPQLPDLEIAETEWELLDLDCGEVVRVRVRVGNIGPGSSDAVETNLILDEVVLCAFVTPPLESASSVWSDWCEVELPSPGSVDLLASTDAAEEMIELNEQNNSEVIEVETEGCIDLVIEEIELSPVEPECGIGGEARLKVGNLGSIASGRSFARVFQNGEFVERISIPSIEAGTPGFSGFVTIAGFEGEVEISACVDVDETVPELDEDNNCASTSWDTGSCSGWSPDFGPNGLGADGPVYALIEWRGRTIAAGEFSEIGGVRANSIAEFDGVRWRGLAGGVEVGNGPGIILSLVVFEGDLIVGGSFDEAGGAPARDVARWTGSTWIDYNQLGLVRALAVYNGELISAGDFLEFNHVARWTGTGWNALGGGTNESGATVLALEVLNGILYAGGSFTRMGSADAQNVAGWTGSSWFPLGFDLDGFVFTLEGYGERLHAGGAFSMDGGGDNLGVWTGNSWSEFQGGANGTVLKLENRGSSLFAAGQFSVLGGSVAAARVGVYTGSRWSAYGSGLSGRSEIGFSLLPTSSGLWVGGSFDRAGPELSDHIAFWRN